MTETNSLPDADIGEIKRLIPHRYPFLLIDKVTDIVSGTSAIGLKNVTINEPFFQGHFPDKPVMPGVLMIEAMAQTAAVLVGKTLDMMDANNLVYFMSIDSAKFRKPVGPGDQLLFHVAVERSRRQVWKFTGEARVAGTLVAESGFSAMIVPPEEA